MKKKVLIVIGIIFAIYILFVTVECIRLGNADRVAEPIITVSSEKYDNRSKYTGLGYSVIYHVDGQENTDGDIYGAEFRLFDSILVWGWIE